MEPASAKLIGAGLAAIGAGMAAISAAVNTAATSGRARSHAAAASRTAGPPCTVSACASA